jgi:cystathionine beta-lyase
MKVDFDAIIDREGSWAEKYDARQRLFGRADVKPLWVADMDFATPPMVLDAIQRRLQHPILGYTEVPVSLAQVVCDWQARQHGWQPHPNDVVWLSGVVSGLYVAIQAYTHVREAVMVFTPVYPPFMRAVTDLERQLIAVPLLLSEDRKHYQLNIAQIEAEIVANHVRLLLLSNPHNPSGRVWSRLELIQLSDICLRYGVVMVSDEIWSDLVINPDVSHVPLASLSDAISQHCITLHSPSKTFNVAALHTAYAMIANETLRTLFVQMQHKTRAGEAGLLGLHALQAVYTDAGAAWLQQLKAYLQGNVALVEREMKTLGIGLMSPDASYLCWLDFSADWQQHDALVAWCVAQGLGLSSGTHFGAEGALFMRLNIALPRLQLTTALQALTHQ